MSRRGIYKTLLKSAAEWGMQATESKNRTYLQGDAQIDYSLG